jgi:hypothetical protein
MPIAHELFFCLSGRGNRNQARLKVEGLNSRVPQPFSGIEEDVVVRVDFYPSNGKCFCIFSRARAFPPGKPSP